MTTLAVRGLHVRYGERTVLDDVSFEVGPGEILGFVGANGAGKTTTMRAVLGMVVPDAGDVLVDGAPIDAARRRRIGYMPEERGLYPRMRVGDQLVHLARLHGLDRTAARAAALRWTTRLGVADRLGDPVERLSLGNQQRVQLAAALVHDPDLLVLDEPFSGLDPVAQPLHEVELVRGEQHGDAAGRRPGTLPTRLVAPARRLGSRSARRRRRGPLPPRHRAGTRR